MSILVGRHRLGSLRALPSRNRMPVPSRAMPGRRRSRQDRVFPGIEHHATIAPAPAHELARPLRRERKYIGLDAAPQLRATDTSTTKTESGTPNTDTTTPKTDTSTPQSDEPRTVLNTNSADPNANDPLLEPPPLPKTKPTLIGGTAARVDHMRNLLTIQPFGGGQKIKVFVDERSHIYRNGEETTVLGIRKGDRVYVDTMLDGSRVFAKNVRVETQTGVAEVRGQVTAVNREKGTVTVRDELSSQPVTFAVGSSTQYSALQGIGQQQLTCSPGRWSMCSSLPAKTSTTWRRR